MDTTASNTPSRIYRVRRVGTQWHVTYTDGRPATAVPIVNSGRYTSRVSYNFGPDGALDTMEVSR